jgi:anthranilate phosphoribosyltransferase
MILRDLMRILGSARRDGRNLTSEEAYRAFDSIFAGEQSEIQIGAFLIALRWKGVSVEEMTAFARAARSRATIPCVGMTDLVCVCPPHDGSEQAPPLEVAASLAAAAAGVRVLLIADRSVPPKRGLTAANALESLGLSMTWDAAEAEDWVARARFAAISASGMLPALMTMRRVRAEIGVRTPLATVEKLIAPASASILIGAQAGPVLGHAVEVLHALGHPSGIAIQGREGGIVPSIKRRSRGIEFTRTQQVPLSIEPGDFGVAAECEPELPLYSPPDDGYGAADVPELVRASGDMTRAVLDGQTGGARNATLLAAALILKSAGRVMTIADGVSAAAEAIDSGGARAIVERLRQLA